MSLGHSNWKRRRRPARLKGQCKSQARIIISLLAPLLSLVGVAQAPLPAPSHQNEFQLAGQSGGQALLPCLIGRQLFCGEPYFIAWYRLNSSSRAWTRIEQQQQQQQADSPASQSLNERAHFNWAPGKRQPATGCPNSPAALGRAKEEQAFDCVQLQVRNLQLSDEAQYKCEITYSESLDFEHCPVSTLSSLAVLGEYWGANILLNARSPARPFVHTPMASGAERPLAQ